MPGLLLAVLLSAAAQPAPGAGPNLLRNGDFEAVPDAQGRPPGWGYSYLPQEGEGVITLVDGGRPGGRRCVDYHKTDDHAWFPQLWTQPTKVEPGATYRVTGWFRSDQPFVLRHTFSAGDKVEKHSLTVAPAPEWRQESYELTVPTRFDRVALGFQLSQRAGHILVDDVSLVRVTETFAAAPDLPEADDLQRLTELASRRRFKPYALLQTEGSADQGAGGYETDRVIFRDTATGATIVKLTRSGGVSTRHTYMEMSPWNADGSRLLLTTGQLGRGSYLAPADGRAWRKQPWYASSYQWDALDPALIYYREQQGNEWVLLRRRLDDPAGEPLKRFTGDLSLWPMSQDGRKLLLQQRLPGTPPSSVIWVMDRDGQRFTALHPPHEVHQTWFTKLPDYSVEYEYEGQEPRGQYAIGLDDQVRKITDETFGHRAHSPDGQWVSVIGRCRVVSIDGKQARTLADAGSDHQTWRTSNDWFACSAGRDLLRVSTTGRFGFQRIGSHNSSLKHSTYWSEAHPEMSADGTKLAFASNMLHDIEFYWTVMGLPEAPTGLTAQRQGRDVVLNWSRPKQSVELAGYLVYRGATSGQRGELLTHEPLPEPRFTDAGAVAGNWVYSVSAVEHSGLESRLSHEAVVGAIAEAPVLEAEDARFAAPAEEVFDPTASGLRAVQLGSVRAAPEAQGEVELATGGPRRLCVRVRAPRDTQGQPVAAPVQLALDGRAETVQVEQAGWHWVAGAPAEVTAGRHRLSFASARAGVAVDQVVLAPPDWRPPVGAARADGDAPAAPQALRGNAASPYAVRLTWRPALERDVDHYNVYAGNGPVTAVQERLVGSPAAPTYLDWGLQAGKDFNYRVTAVDRAGNESPASGEITVTTPAVPDRVLVRHELDLAMGGKTDLALELAKPTQLVLWVRARSRSGKLMPYRLKVELDGQPLAERTIGFDYVCVGHGGPVVGEALWDAVRRPAQTPTDPPGLDVPAGKHRLTLSIPPDADMQLDRLVVTNDLGYLPPGRCDFLVKPVRPETEPDA